MWGDLPWREVVDDEDRDLFPKNREDFAKGRDLRKGERVEATFLLRHADCCRVGAGGP